MSIKTTKVVEFEVGDLLVKYPMRRKTPVSPTSKTPPPSEAMVETRPEWGALDSEEFSAKLEAWHAQHNQ